MKEKINEKMNSTAYIKMGIMKREQEEKVEQLKIEAKCMKEMFGRKSIEYKDVMNELNIEKRILKVIYTCQNYLYL